MPNTPILGITQVSASQNQKEVTINDAILALENATNRKLVVSFASASSVLLSDSQATRNMMFEATEATAAATLRFPNTISGQDYNRVIVVRNTSGQALTVKFDTGAGSQVVVPDGEARLLAAMDGLNVTVAAQPTTTATFLSLSDTPSSYATFAGKVLAVNATADALEFIDAAIFPTLASNAGKVLAVKGDETGVEWVTPVASFTDLDDTPANFTGAANKMLAVKADETGVEFVDPPEAEAVEYIASTKWRVRTVIGGLDSDYIAVSEIDLLDRNGISLLGTGTAISSSFEVGKEPSYAFDGDLTDGTGWFSDPADIVDSWVGYEFLSAEDVRKVKMWSVPSFPDYMPTRIIVERWNGAAWVAAGEFITENWTTVPVQTFKVLGSTLSSVSDAPSDGVTYGRMNGTWTDISERVRDVIGAALVQGTNVNISVNDAGDQITVTVAPDTDGTLSANSDTLVPSQKAVKTYVDASVTGLLDFKGVTDCSTNPNYPAASKGDAYVVSVAGKIGGASGQVVDAGDWFIAIADNAGGTEASVGASWKQIERNSALQVLSTGATFTGAVNVPDDAYDEAAWNGSTEVPTKNAIRDKIESLVIGGGGGGSGGTGGSYSAVLIARKTTNQSIVTGAWRDVTWDESYDNAGIFTTGATDFTVPSGCTFMEVNVRVGWANDGTSARYLQLYNVTTATVEALEVRDAANETGQTMNTGLIPVTPGHVYRIQANSGSATLNMSGTGYGGASTLDVRFVSEVAALLDGGGLAASDRWVLVDTNGVETTGATWSYSAPVASVDVKNLTDYSDILIVVNQVTADVSGSRAIQVSVDNGVSFYSASGDYVSLSTSGVRTNTTDIARHITFTTAARDVLAFIPGAGTSAPIKRAQSIDGENRSFVASPLPINAIRLINSTGGNLTGGSFSVYVRKRQIVSEGEAATAGEIWTGTSSAKVITPATFFAASATTALTDGATINIDGNTGINFRVTLGGSRTLANPTNMKTGQSGVIIVTQDATGGRTLAYGSNWRFAGGAAAGGVLSTAPNAVDVISYYVRSDGTILANLAKDYKA
jgi:hypothetical protein